MPRRIGSLGLTALYLWVQDVEMQALFKNDQFSVEGELARQRREEGAHPLLNPSITRERPIFDESIDLGISLPAGTQHRFSTGGPAKVQVKLLQCCGSREFILDPGFGYCRPGSRIWIRNTKLIVTKLTEIWSETVLRIQIRKPGWVNNQDPDLGSGSGMNNPDHRIIFPRA
jgi:hypothetical protein